MSASSFLLREPLLDPSRKVIAHELRWQAGAQPVDDADGVALGLLLAAELHRGDEGWLLADGKLMLPVGPAFLQGAAIRMLPGAAFTLVLEEGADIAPEPAAEARKAGFGVALRGLSGAPGLFPHLSGYELDGAASDLAATPTSTRASRGAYPTSAAASQAAARYMRTWTRSSAR